MCEKCIWFDVAIALSRRDFRTNFDPSTLHEARELLAVTLD